jgi:hypothetical protein
LGISFRWIRLGSAPAGGLAFAFSGMPPLSAQAAALALTSCNARLRSDLMLWISAASGAALSSSWRRQKVIRLSFTALCSKRSSAETEIAPIIFSVIIFRPFFVFLASLSGIARFITGFAALIAVRVCRFATVAGRICLFRGIGGKDGMGSVLQRLFFVRHFIAQGYQQSVNSVETAVFRTRRSGSRVSRPSPSIRCCHRQQPNRPRRAVPFPAGR